MPPALAAFDLVPGPGLAPAGRPHTWHAAAPVVGFAAAAPLPPGWYRVRLRVRAADRLAVRKRGELAADLPTGPARLETFEWNEALAEDLFVRLPEPARGLHLTFRHAAGTFRVERFDVRPVTRARAFARAARLKLGLVTAYNCFWPVVARGWKLLAGGRVREFGRKVFAGLADSRSMRIEVKRAAEANAAWWRRRALPADQSASLRREAEAIPAPVPLAVIVPADPTRVDYARHAAMSVCTQLYPHWELVVVWPMRKVPDRLASAVRWEARARVVSADGFPAAVRRALTGLRSGHALVLPPEWELAGHALLRFAQAVGTDPAAAAACDPPDLDSPPPAVLPVGRLAAGLADLGPTDSAVRVVRWAAKQVPADRRKVPEPLAVSVTGGLVGGRPVAGPAGAAGPPLTLAGDIRGLSGWDYVAFEMLRGLRSLGVDVRKHPGSQVFPDLVPPEYGLRTVVRTPADPQLVVSPPFLAGRFTPDRKTAILTMWEADRLAAADVAVLNKAGLVVVPSWWGAECFRASGVTVPVAVVPLGYDPLVFHPGGDPPADACVFGTAGALCAGGLRKNVARVIDLFRRAFPTEPDARLRVKITPNCPHLAVPDDPRIDVLRATLPHADLAAWNRSLTCYVNASFAEGFGLHLLEAMACGRPLVSTAYSGPTEFFDGAVGYPVPHRVVPVRNEYYSGHWADPDDDALIDTMRRVYRDRDEARRLGRVAAARARRFTWRDAGRKLAAVLAGHGFLPTGGM